MKEKIYKPFTNLLECVELAIIANGGGAHKKEMCGCDPSVGMSPCEYCAIWNALNKTYNYLLDLKGGRSNGTVGALAKKWEDDANAYQMAAEEQGEMVGIANGKYIALHTKANVLRECAKELKL